MFHSEEAVPPCQPTDVPRFDLEGSAEWMGFLEENGFVVLKDIALPDQIEKAKGLFWDFMEGHCGVKRGDSATWTSESWPGFLKTGVISKCPAGNSDFMWYLRTLPPVRQIFECVWGSRDLLSSFDGCGAFRPFSQRPEWRTQGRWFHVDQGGSMRGKQCVQGFLNLIDANETTGGLIVIPGSHRQHDGVLNRNKHKGQFCLIGKSDPVLEVNGIMPRLQAGDFVLWDSRTVHCNHPSLTPPEHPMDSLVRLVGYICMLPLSMAQGDPKALLKERRKAFVDRLTCSHWPTLVVSNSKPVDPKERRDLKREPAAVCDLVSGTVPAS